MKKIFMKIKKSLLVGTLAALCITPYAQASIMQVPVSSTAAEINGQQVLTQVFEIEEDGSFDPAQLIEDDFVRGEYVYSFDRITKEESETTETKDVEQQSTVSSDTDNLQSNIDLFAGSVQYEDAEGFTGTLTLDTSSIQTTTDGYETTSRQITETRTFDGMEYNDPTLIPLTVEKDGYTLSRTDLEWSEETYLTDDSGQNPIPATFSATATYAKTLYSEVPTGYTVTAKYKGEVSRTVQGPTEYTLTYIGTKIPEEIVIQNSGFFGNMDNTQAMIITAASVLGLLLMITLIILIIRKLVKRGRKGGKAPMTNGTDLSNTGDENDLPE